jgi:DNA invertase Pin-like site-specific DNA recombinase
MPTAYSYLRFSSIGQRKGTSEAGQESTPVPWCQANGYTLDTSLKLRDLGRSGYHGDHIRRGALGVFLDLVRQGRIERGSALLVEHLDRLTRQDPYTAMGTIRDIIDAGVELVTLSDGERYNRQALASDPFAPMRLQFALFQNHAESDKKSKRLQFVWKARREAAREGEPVNARRPGWSGRDGRSVIEEKADVIRRIFKLALEGIGPNTIAKRLNAEWVAPIGHGKRWSGTTVRHYLTTRTPIGEFQPCRTVAGKEIPDGPPVADFDTPIIDRDTFLNVQRTLKDRSDRKARGRIAQDKNLFTGLLFSAFDGGRYHYKESSRTYKGKAFAQRHLIPYNRVDGVPGSMTVTIRYDAFERAFFRFVREADPRALFMPEDRAEKAKELVALTAERFEVESTIAATKGGSRPSGPRACMTCSTSWMRTDRS